MLSRKDFLVPDQAAVRERVLAKNVEAPDLATVKDFFRFCAATGKGKIVNKIICDSLNAVAELFFAGFTRVTDTQINEDDRSEVYNVSIFRTPRKRDNTILRVFEGFERRAQN
jgi:hypothetical protein